MVNNLPCNAGDMGSIPGQKTKIPTCRRTAKSSHGGTGTTEPMCSRAWVPQLESLSVVCKIQYSQIN